MNRRTFFMCGAAALWAQAPPSRQIVVGLIGAGARGMQFLKLLLAHPSVRIGAVCETYEPRMFEAGALARSRGHSARYYRLYQDLLSDKSLDAVVIATPDFWHCRMTVEALAEGKDVYVEQPLCRTWQEGLAMIAAHGRSKQIVQAGSQRRSSPYFVPLAARVRDKEFGVVKRVEGRAASSYLRRGVLQRGPTKLPDPLNFEDWQAGAQTRVAYSPDRFLNWRFYSAYGGGCVADLGAALLDGVHMLAGAGYPISVTAHGEKSKADGFDTAGRASLEIEYAGGVVASLSIDGASARPADLVRIHGDRGRIEANAKAGADATAIHLAEFLASVRSRMTPSASPDVVFPATLACQMANLSISNGRKMYWRADQKNVEG